MNSKKVTDNNKTNCRNNKTASFKSKCNTSENQKDLLKKMTKSLNEAYAVAEKLDAHSVVNSDTLRQTFDV
ncbi:MAG: hypothetical protein R6W70_04545 [bacterium]